MRTNERRLRLTSTLILDTLFPPICPGCGRRGHWVCDDCRSAVTPITHVACARCGAIWSGRCVCEGLPRAVVGIRSAMPFDGWVRQAIHAFKYEGERARARHLADLLEPLLESDEAVDVTVPVPLHPTRMRERGFNQAALLAGRLAGARGDVPVVEIERRGAPTPQVGLTADQRRANVADVFFVPNPSALAGRSVVLVDDVITTTATVTACAQALALAGATTIRCLSVARALS